MSCGWSRKFPPSPSGRGRCEAPGEGRSFGKSCDPHPRAFGALPSPRGRGILLCLFFLATPCIAQQVPSWEFFGGYSFQETNVRKYFRSTPIIFSFQNHYTGLNGWDVSATENVNRWFGGTLDISGHYG